MNHNLNQTYKADCIIIGAGIFGLYAALLLAKKKKKVIVLEKGLEAFSRASAINQARVHNGYHYPRSYKTAKKSAYYYERFVRDFHFAINDSFKQIYAVSLKKSKTSAKEFVDFCNFVQIDLQEIDKDIYFKKDVIDAAFLTNECSFDYIAIKNYLLEKLQDKVDLFYDARILSVAKKEAAYVITLDNFVSLKASLVINASYSGINHINEKFGQEKFKLKYELCEVSFCNVPSALKDIGITVMDGDYFSLMPFGHSKMHSLTSVEHTPRYIPYETMLKDMETLRIGSEACAMHNLRGCDLCSQSFASAWQKMYQPYQTYMKDDFPLTYRYSKFDIKAILLESEEDDSRPTIIKQDTTGTTFISVFSGKLSTIFDLENYL